MSCTCCAVSRRCLCHVLVVFANFSTFNFEHFVSHKIYKIYASRIVFCLFQCQNFEAIAGNHRAFPPIKFAIGTNNLGACHYCLPCHGPHCCLPCQGPFCEGSVTAAYHVKDHTAAYHVKDPTAAYHVKDHSAKGLSLLLTMSSEGSVTVLNMSRTILRRIYHCCLPC